MKSPSKSRGVGLAYGNFLQIMGESHIIKLIIKLYDTRKLRNNI